MKGVHASSPAVCLGSVDSVLAQVDGTQPPPTPAEQGGAPAAQGVSKRHGDCRWQTLARRQKQPDFQHGQRRQSPSPSTQREVTRHEKRDGLRGAGE